MEVEANYLLIWIVYLIAGAIFYGVFWLVTKFNKAKWTSYSLRAAAASEGARRAAAMAGAARAQVWKSNINQR